MRTYQGHLLKTHDGENRVTVTNHFTNFTKPLDPCLNVRNHSPTGFAWGYSGSGPAQLALAICCDLLQDDQRAMRVYQRVKDHFIARLNQQTEWMLRDSEIFAFIDRIEEEQQEVPASKSMLFEHVETGIQIVVRKEVETARYEIDNGEATQVLNAIKYRTAAGQDCIPLTPCRPVTEDPQSLILRTNYGSCRITRISE